MANLSDLVAASDPCPPSWIGTLGASRGFVPTPGLHPNPSINARQPSGEDPAEVMRKAAYREGFEAGRAQAQAEYAGQASIADTLGLALARLDQAAERALRQRLTETVASLCEQMIEPHLIDGAALERRCGKALSWIEEGPEQLTLRLHPDDIALLSDATRAAWSIRAEPALPRGTLQIETREGVIRDGPDEWRRAITQALTP